MTITFDNPDLVSKIAGFIPHEDMLNFAQVNNLCHQVITQLPNFQEVVDEAFDTALDNDIDNPQILLKIDKRIHLVSEKFFFENATLGELFDYYSGHNELRIAQFVSTRSPKNLKILRHLMIQYIRVNDRMNELPWYTRIPLQIFRNGHMNERVLQVMASQTLNYCINNPIDWNWNKVLNRCIINKGIDGYWNENFQEFSDITDLTKEYVLQNILFKATNFLIPSENPIAASLYPAIIAQSGFHVQDTSLTEISSLKGRAICVINALFYATTTLLSISLVAIAIAISIAALPIAAIISGIMAIIKINSYLIRASAAFSLVFTISMLALVIFSAHAITLIRAIGGTILDPSIFLTTNRGISGTIPHLMMGL